MDTLSDSESALIALRQELISNPKTVTESQAGRLRALLPHNPDERVSNLPIAEFIQGEEWFWNAVGTLAATYGENIYSSDPNTRWYRDVVKAMLVYADPEGLTGIDSISGSRSNIKENLNEIAQAVKAKSVGDLGLYTRILERLQIQLSAN